MSRLFAIAALLGAFLVSAPLSAQVTAHFRVHSLDGGCENGKSEPWGFGDPDRYFRLGIFDNASLWNTCAAGCTADSSPTTADVTTSDEFCGDWNEGCGPWTGLNRTVSKVIASGSGAHFYFGLYDADSLDADDHIGDHWFSRSTPVSNHTQWNNNSAQYKPDNPITTVCGRDVEVVGGGGGANNYQVTYSVWFTDSSGPSVSSSKPYNQDDGLYDVDDNDTRLDFQWNLASDPHSGIAGYNFDLENVTTGSMVFNNQTAPSDGAISLCPSGCYRSFTPQDGHRYRFRIRARNGNVPTLNNQQTATSAWSDTIRVDLTAPTSNFVAPAESSWHNGDFSIDFQDIDPAGGSGLDSNACDWRITSDGVVTADWASRACNGARTATVGAGAACNREGADACVITTRSTDLARNDSAVGTRSFGIDWTEDSIGAITVRDQAGGTIQSGWTMDRDPYFSWDAATSISPIAGYSWAMNASPDCGSIEVAAGAPLEVAIPIGQLTDGVHQFQVRAIDEAGNCGPVQSATVQVDGTAENVVNLHAFDRNNDPISPATWQQENAPTMQWDAPTSISPIVGYSYGTGPNTDCVIEANLTTVAVGTLPEGINSFWVRAVDAAGNCGPPATFGLHVDSVPDPIFGVVALTQQAGSPIPQSTPQPDNSPWFQWNVPLSTSPIAGYSYGVGATTDCTIDTQMPGAGLTNLPEGATTFWVRAIDSAGNCGPAATFEIVVSICGDGNVGPGEQCDDGNDDATDACVMCLDAVCGDGHIWDGNEECDDGADNSDTEPDACRTDCTAPRCGDGIVDSGEGCDEGDLNSDDPDATCRTNCALATCGDGVLDDGEACDDGENNSDEVAGACRTTCVLAFCGDGVVDALEACDEGAANSDTAPDTCRTDCSTPLCGDGVLDTGEECDDGAANSDTDADACRTTCMASYCGDGVLDANEQCEPSISGDDLCNQDCTFGATPMEPEPDDVGHAEPGSDVGNPTPTPDMGHGAPDVATPDWNPDVNTASEASCCAQVHSRSFNGWQLLLAAVAAGMVVRRRR